MDQSNMKFVTGLFDENLQAEAAISWLLRKSFRSCEISILYSEASSKSSKTFLSQSRSISSLSYLRHLTVPSLGELVCGGPIAAMLTNCSVSGYLQDMPHLFEELGIPRLQATFYCQALSDNKAILYVQTQDTKSEDEAKQIFLDAGAESIFAFSPILTNKSLRTEFYRFDYPFLDEELKTQKSYRPLN